MPEGLPSDGDFEALLRRERIQQLANESLNIRYRDYPELSSYAEQRSELVCSALRDGFGPDIPFPREAEETMRAAYKKLYFTFTDAHDHRNTPPQSMLYTVSEEVMSAQGEIPPNMVVFASSLNHLACQLFLLHHVLDARGELYDIARGHQLFYVKNRLDLLTLGVDPAHPGSGTETDGPKAT